MLTVQIPAGVAESFTYIESNEVTRSQTEANCGLVETTLLEGIDGSYFAATSSIFTLVESPAGNFEIQAISTTSSDSGIYNMGLKVSLADYPSV